MKGNKNLSERFLNFSIDIINLTKDQNKSFALKHISNQLLRSGTSAGANYEEACCGESKKDFIHKLHIVFKELQRSHMFLYCTISNLTFHNLLMLKPKLM